jgi:hypothetical protein
MSWVHDKDVKISFIGVISIAIWLTEAVQIAGQRRQVLFCIYFNDFQID